MILTYCRIDQTIRREVSSHGYLEALESIETGLQKAREMKDEKWSSILKKKKEIVLKKKVTYESELAEKQRLSSMETIDDETTPSFRRSMDDNNIVFKDDVEEVDEQDGDGLISWLPFATLAISAVGLFGMYFMKSLKQQ